MRKEMVVLFNVEEMCQKMFKNSKKNKESNWTPFEAGRIVSHTYN
jgi:hypothetical protein